MSTPFEWTRRVEFGDTDMAGIAHFSNFFRYMEAAETAFLKSRGLSVAWAEGEKRYGFPRVKASCDYLSPARFDDVLTVRVSVERIGAKSVAYKFEFSNNGKDVALGHMTAVYCRGVMGSDGQHQIESLLIPEALRERLAS